MAKQAKLPQTQWTEAGRNISNTATPLYQSNLRRMDEYLSDPQVALDSYLNKYYGVSAIQNQDFLNAYNRAMGQRTGANYAATGGGYTSSGDRAYSDQQKYYNDLASRLNQYGIQSSYGMANQDYQNMLGANTAYNTAYKLGQNYSNIEQQNALADQANKNWIAPVATIAGTALGSLVGAPMIGTALGGALGNAFTTDTSGAMASIYGGGGNASDWANGGTFTNMGAGFKNVDWAGERNALMNNLNKWLGRGVTTQNAKTGLTIRP